MNTFELSFAGKKITLTVNKFAPQTNASVVAQIGQTIVLATVVMGSVDETKDYFPLQVEFVDKLYAGGLVKGGKWVKREGGPSDASVLFGRIIDRSIRPLFPKDFHNEVQVVVTVLSNDKVNDVVIPAFLATSTALAISDIPFKSAVSAVRVGQINGQFIVNPIVSELAQSTLDLLVCTGPSGVNMIEAGANIVANDVMYQAIELAKTTGDDLNSQIIQIAAKIGKPKVDYQPAVADEKLAAEVEKLIAADVVAFYQNGADGTHQSAENQIFAKVKLAYGDQLKSQDIKEQLLLGAVDAIIQKYVRAQTFKGLRYDKRQLNEIRPLSIEAGVLPCTHGSALFQRGLTQALTVTTLAPLAEKQCLQDSSGETTKRYLHYYSAMPFSTGQTGRIGRPGRREIGHGALAEKALIPVIPTENEFPYTIALTSEVLSQNGSSSMASTCGSTLSLMDAGVPIKDKVAGISVGLIANSDSEYVLLTDIAGLEDHHGDMDFKITGTRQGITAIQLDIKREGLTLKMIQETIEVSYQARLQILEAIDKVISAPRTQLSAFAPKIKMVILPEDKIGDVIGSGGKTIRALMEKYQVQIDIDDDGKASISAINEDNVNAAVKEIEAMIKEVQIGEEYPGVVTRVENYGAFVEFLPGREALLHVSELSGGFLDNPSSVIKIGDKLNVKISGFNDNHQIKLSAPEFKAAHPGQPRQAQSRASFAPRSHFPIR